MKVGDKVSEGSVVLTLESDGARQRRARNGDESRAGRAALRTTSAPPTAELVTPSPRGEKGRADMPGEGSNSTPPAGPTIEVRVPDIGDFTDVPVIEVFVKPGDIVQPDDPLVTLESDKATMDVPSPVGGIVEGVRVSVGERGERGHAAAVAEDGADRRRTRKPRDAADASGQHRSRDAADRRAPDAGAPRAPGRALPRAAQRQRPKSCAPLDVGTGRIDRHRACVAVGAQVRARARRRHRAQSRGSGPKGRILEEDVQAFVKRSLAAGAAPARPRGRRRGGGALNLLPWPQVGFREVRRRSRPRRCRGSGRSPAPTSRATG